jgi:hypothetical protein
MERLLSSRSWKTDSEDVKARQSYHLRAACRNLKVIKILCLCFRLAARKSSAEFHYTDFADASDLVLNGDAFVITTCIDDARDSPPLYYQGEEVSRQLSSSLELITAYEKENNRTVMEKTTATFGHRYDSSSSKHDPIGHCEKRLRLTPSHPSNVGSAWYEKTIPVVRF